MKRALIAIVDAAHARLFTYQQVDENEPTLRELRELVSPGRQGHDLFSDTKPGNRWQEGGRGSTDDHRNDHIAELDARFAKQIIAEMCRAVADENFHHVILVASPKMLGELRRADAPLRRGDIVIDEVPQDLAWLTPPQVHDHLAQMKLIDPRPRAPMTRGARSR
ncbi:MAG TPA: host attachment protein [Kofleriaceae bacterium]|nr:host attachment protein [Kofleriaceae bacterium]